MSNNKFDEAIFIIIILVHQIQVGQASLRNKKKTKYENTVLKYVALLTKTA